MTMNAKSLLIATLAAALTGAAFAESRKTEAELQQEAQLRAPSNISRASVLAELARARADGTLVASLNTEGFGSRAVTGSSANGLTRAAVLAEVRRAVADGSLPSNPDYGHRASAAVKAAGSANVALDRAAR
jgi:hypothetical protein